MRLGGAADGLGCARRGGRSGSRAGREESSSAQMVLPSAVADLIRWQITRKIPDEL